MPININLYSQVIMASTSTATTSMPKTMAEAAASNPEAAAAASKIDWKKLNKLRQDQREISSRIGLLDNDLSETKLVAEALQQVDPKRKCYRLMGGVLIEHVVEDVIPALDKNKDQLETMVTNAKQELVEKGKAIQAFMTENNISLRKH